MSKMKKVISSALVALFVITVFSSFVSADSTVIASGSTTTYTWTYNSHDEITITPAGNSTYLNLSSIPSDRLSAVECVFVDVAPLDGFESITLDGAECSACCLIFINNSDELSFTDFFVRDFTNLNGNDCFRFNGPISVAQVTCMNLGVNSLAFIDNDYNNLDNVGYWSFKDSNSFTGDVTVTDKVVALSGLKNDVNIQFSGNRTTIFEYMFAQDKKLSCISLPQTVTSIEYGAFLQCESLTDFTLPDSVIKIGPMAFRNTGISYIDIPDGVTKIEYETFRCCDELTTVVIPSSVTNIFVNAFSDDDIKDVYFEGTGEQWSKIKVDTATDLTFKISDVFGKDTTVHFADGSVSGWNPKNGSWSYIDSDGTKAIGWKFIDSSWFFFDNDGIMLTGWKQLSGVWYYFDNSGRMATGWKNIAGSDYHFDENGHMAAGWVKIDFEWYYFDENGHPLSGWKKIGNNWYYLEDNGLMVTGWMSEGNTWYYCDTDGHMVTGWKKINGDWFYFESGGNMVTGWKKLSGVWYYFDSNGYMAVSFNTINKVDYYFDENGHMLVDWQLISGEWYYFNENGAMKTGWMKLKGSWYYFYDSGCMATGLVDIGDYTYFFYVNGVMATSDFTYNGNNYSVDGSGHVSKI